MRTRAAAAWLAPLAALGIAMASGQTERSARSTEDDVRAAAFRYHSSLLLGDVDGHRLVCRFPLKAFRDGVMTFRGENETGAIVRSIRDRAGASPLTSDDRQRLAANVLAVFEGASVQFVGANTASVSFVARPGRKADDGDHMALLLLSRTDGKWSVFSEITDSRAVPPSYLETTAPPGRQ